MAEKPCYFCGAEAEANPWNMAPFRAITCFTCPNCGWYGMSNMYVSNPYGTEVERARIAAVLAERSLLPETKAQPEMPVISMNPERDRDSGVPILGWDALLAAFPKSIEEAYDRAIRNFALLLGKPGTVLKLFRRRKPEGWLEIDVPAWTTLLFAENEGMMNFYRDELYKRGILKDAGNAGDAGVMLTSKGWLKFEEIEARKKADSGSLDGATGELKRLVAEAKLDANTLLRRKEDGVLEFKSSLRWDVNRSCKNDDLEAVVVKTVAAFLNTHGGLLGIGFNDSGGAVGLEPDYKLIGKRADSDGFQQLLVTLLSREIGKKFIPSLGIEFKIVSSLEVCLVTVRKSPEPAYVGPQQEFFIRTGNSTQRLATKDAIDYIQKHWSHR